MRNTLKRPLLHNGRLQRIIHVEGSHIIQLRVREQNSSSTSAKSKCLAPDRTKHSTVIAGMVSIFREVSFLLTFSPESCMHTDGLPENTFSYSDG
jgi:hypothetical protein